MKGRIKLGAGIFQDHHFGKWPRQASDVGMTFDVEWTGSYWDCRADGYGYLRSRGEGYLSSRGEDGEYGNGSIFVKDFYGVELIGGEKK